MSHSCAGAAESAAVAEKRMKGKKHDDEGRGENENFGITRCVSRESSKGMLSKKRIWTLT